MVLIRPQPEPEGCRGFRTYARSIPSETNREVKSCLELTLFHIRGCLSIVLSEFERLNQ